MIDLTRYFTILGLGPDATMDEVEQHFHDLAFSMHPDTHEGERKTRFEEKLKNFNHARDMIRKHYDEWRKFRNNLHNSGATTGNANANTDNSGPNSTDPAAAAEAARRRAEQERNRKNSESTTRDESRRQEQEQFQQLHEAYLKAQHYTEAELSRQRESIANVATISLAAVAITCTLAAASNLVATARTMLIQHETNNIHISTKHPYITKQPFSLEPSPSTTTQPPQIVISHVDYQTVRKATSWSISTDSTNPGTTNPASTDPSTTNPGTTTITGTDSTGRKIIVLTYNSDNTYLGHYVYDYYTAPGGYSSSVQIRKFESMPDDSPGNMQCRCTSSITYEYDSSGHLRNVTRHGLFDSLEPNVS